jgi:hypothetical protein
MSRRNRLIEVPALSAKARFRGDERHDLDQQDDLPAIRFSQRHRSTPDRDIELWVQLPALHKHALPASEVDFLAIQLLQPGVPVPLGKHRNRRFTFTLRQATS